MDIDRLFEDRNYLEGELKFFINKKHINIIEENKELVQSHLKKARHNLEFYRANKKRNGFNDWLIVILYYSLYHSALALIKNKNYSSKNHYATILILIREYAITKEDVKLIDELLINKEDAELYTNLREDRQDANYSTNIKFNKQKVVGYEDKVINFINKTEEILNQD